MQKATKITALESTGWDGAIEDAKRHIERLRGVIAACEEKKAKGEPWPGEQAGTDAKSIPA